mmetsp:Transcript_138/g.307  ORF Transcript_138/g.307 Transcript_138/m.307 type:complete len:112 (+) Transcript_138:953-1288(+)
MVTPSRRNFGNKSDCVYFLWSPALLHGLPFLRFLRLSRSLVVLIIERSLHGNLFTKKWLDRREAGAIHWLRLRSLSVLELAELVFQPSLVVFSEHVVIEQRYLLLSQMSVN